MKCYKNREGVVLGGEGSSSLNGGISRNALETGFLQYWNLKTEFLLTKDCSWVFNQALLIFRQILSLETGNTEFVDAEERTDAQETGKPLYENTITTIKKKNKP